jgi:hypothetical protein
VVSQIGIDVRILLEKCVFYDKNNKLRDLKKIIYSTYSPLSYTQTYDFVVLTSLTHPRKIVLVIAA